MNIFIVINQIISIFAVIYAYTSSSAVGLFWSIVYFLFFGLCLYCRISSAYQNTQWRKRYQALNSYISKDSEDVLVSKQFNISDYDYTKELIQRNYPYVEISYDEFKRIWRKNPERFSFWTVRDTKDNALVKSLLSGNLDRLLPEKFLPMENHEAEGPDAKADACNEEWLTKDIVTGGRSFDLFVLYSDHPLDKSLKSIPEDAVFILLNNDEDAMKATMEIVMYAESISRKAQEEAAAACTASVNFSIEANRQKGLSQVKLLNISEQDQQDSIDAKENNQKGCLAMMKQFGKLGQYLEDKSNSEMKNAYEALGKQMAMINNPSEAQEYMKRRLSEIDEYSEPLPNDMHLILTGEDAMPSDECIPRLVLAESQTTSFQSH